MKALLALFSYEANTFNPEVNTVEAAFRQNGAWRVGAAEVRDWAVRGQGELTGSMAYLEERNWTAEPVFAASARASGGRLDADGYRTLRDTMYRALEAALPADAIILHLHGAACAVGVDDPEGDLLSMVRTELGFEGRVAVSLDLHGNVTRKMLAHADVITAFRTFPHTDQQATGRRAAALALQPDATTRAVAKLGMLLPPTATHDQAGDFARMQALARQAEEADDIDDVALLPVQPWLDIAELGSAVVVTGRSDGPARAARRLAEDWYAHRARYPDGLVSMAAILQTLAVKAHRPWILADTADAITGGSSGRSAYVLQALLPHADAFCAPILLQVVDPETVDRAEAGQTSFRIGDQKVPVQASRVRTAEGRYAPRGRSYRGIETSMRGAAVIETGKLQMVAAREPTLGVMDPAFYECVGLDPESALAVQVKSLTGWMSGYEGCANQGLYVDGPGATSLNFTALPFLPPNDRIYPLVDPDPPPLQIWTSDAKLLRSVGQIESLDCGVGS
jgi:microcystin degradation protein MlrC